MALILQVSRIKPGNYFIIICYNNVSNLLASAPAAFNNAIMFNSRWLLGGQSLDANVRSSHFWTNVLSVNENNQWLFLRRIMYLRDICFRRSGKSTVTRLTVQEWDVEMDKMALGTYILNSLECISDDDGNKVFTESDTSKIVSRLVEGNPN